MESRHVDAAHKRWVFPKSESKNKKLSRVVYMTDPAFAIVERRMASQPPGTVFRNSAGRRWTTDAVNCAFARIRDEIGRRRMAEQDIELDEAEIKEFAATLKREKTERGKRRPKTERELLGEARRKLFRKKSRSLVAPYSLYVLRHSWATHALQRGVDPLTVAILMGHSDPSMLAKVYQYLSLNPTHLRSQLEKAVG